MTLAKRHHYLPRFYLDGFGPTGRIWVHDRVLGETRHTTPKSTAVISGYYTMDDADGTAPDIEGMFARLESDTASVIKKLSAAEEISRTEKATVSLFVAFLLTRVPQFERRLDESATPVYRKMLQLSFATPERAAAALETIERETGAPADVTADEMREYFAGDDFRVKMPRNFSLTSSLQLALDIAVFFERMRWRVMHCEPKKSFITSDAPVLLVAPPDHDPDDFRGAGILTPGATTIVSLDQSTSLEIGAPGEGISHHRLKREGVRNHNMALARTCERIIVARDRALIESIVRATGIDTSSPAPLVRSS